MRNLYLTLNFSDGHLKETLEEVTRYIIKMHASESDSGCGADKTEIGKKNYNFDYEIK